MREHAVRAGRSRAPAAVPGASIFEPSISQRTESASDSVRYISRLLSAGTFTKDAPPGQSRNRPRGPTLASAVHSDPPFARLGPMRPGAEEMCARQRRFATIFFAGRGNLERGAAFALS